MARVWVLFTLLVLNAAQAAEVEIPLRLPMDAIRDALASRVAYREGPCRYLKLQAPPSLAGEEGKLKLSAPASAALGLDLLGNCQNAVEWRGTMQFTLEPLVDAAGRLRLRIVDSQLVDAGGSPSVGFIWELSKRYVHPQLERFAYDLARPRAELLQLVHGAAPAPYGQQLEEVIKNLSMQQPQVEATAITLPIRLDVPDAWLAAAPAAAPAAPLTDSEMEALEQALQPWDAFLVYTIKQLARDTGDPSLRPRLFALLLDSRYRLSAILAGDEPAGDDALHRLFVDAWTDLRAIVADAERSGLRDGSLLRYAAFLDAGDALVTLDRAAPALRLRPSADALRQLARSLQPGAAGDPLAFGWAVDPELGTLFGVPAIPEPQPRRSFLDLFIRSALAAPETPALDRWVPGAGELDLYEEQINRVLGDAAKTELARVPLSAPYDAIYLKLVPATALIESCWRQYVKRGGRVSYLRSGSGSIGIMQINQRVWRGFYDRERLRWSTAYNVRAGTQILMRYLKDYAIPYATKSGDPSDAPRAVYAVYNAGPRAVGRFAKENAHPREKRVDGHFWDLYRAIAAGGRADLKSCGVSSQQ
jgi:hypothetical protein